MVWYSHLFKNFPEFVVIHTVKGFDTVNKAKVDEHCVSISRYKNHQMRVDGEGSEKKEPLSPRLSLGITRSKTSRKHVPNDVMEQ